MFDFHIHSIHSDGQYSVDELIKHLKEMNIKYFAICDHNTIQSLKFLKNYTDIHYINGVEINACLNNQYKLHILGYKFNENSKELTDMLNELKIMRKQRFIEMAEYLEKHYKIIINKEDIEYILSQDITHGKPHLAMLLIKYGYVKSVNEAFDKYLSHIHTPTDSNLDAKRVIDVIHQADGIAILAHPKKYEKKYNIDFREIMKLLKEYQIDGIEIYNSLHNYKDCLRYYDYASEYNLITTGGSDFHGPSIKPSVKLNMLNKENIINPDIKINIL